MSAVVADTHTVIWLLFAPQTLSDNAFAALNGAIQSGEPIYVASISVVEVVYLVEKGRLPEVVLGKLLSELLRSDSGLSIVSLDLAISQTLQQVSRSDMPDRIIAATALHLGLPLVTRDLRIQSSSIVTIW